MMSWHIEIKDKEGVFDAVGEAVKKDIRDLGITGVKKVSFSQVYKILGNIPREDLYKICEELLVDKVSQEYSVNKKEDKPGKKKNEWVVEVEFNPGVMDPVEESTVKGIRDLGVRAKVGVKTAKRYRIHGRLTPAQLKFVCEKLLYNKLIQRVVEVEAGSKKEAEPAVAEGAEELKYRFKLACVNIIEASDKQLEKINKEGQLFLSLEEMRHIQKYFKKLKRNPTDCELETVAQTWSEHCWHKTFRGKIDYTEGDKRTLIDNLLKSTIMKVTNELKKPWCVSVFKDNAGVINFDDKNNVCFKVETHNHPSALEPFGGANTGVGGVIRDCLGTGLGAKPIANTDVFCFAPPEYDFKKVPDGCLHPKRVMKGVVSGVRDYGNKMGIPTVNGAVLFHEKFVGNPLVYCGTIGILPKDKSFKKVKKGELILVVGGKTGRDGIHGATFSSGELTHESEKVSSGAVQIGNPIQEKKVLDAIMIARDRGLYSAITDCGAGGLSSAVGEMGSELGARVFLERVPLKYSGLSYTEIWISESQERMVLSVPKDNILDILDVFSSEDVQATVIGEFTGSKRLKLYYDNNLVCDLDMKFLHEGIPILKKKAVYVRPQHKEPQGHSCPKDLGKTLLSILSGYDVCSKEWIIRQYDHEVQGGSVLKPLCGRNNDGPSDAAIIKPVFGSERAVAVSNGINFRYGMVDPYWMAASCIDESLRQIIAVGGSLKETALLDNFCWGSPDKPERLGELVRAAKGCYDAAKAFEVPFISGKDSLNNEYNLKGQSISIPSTLLISAISVVPDCSRAVSMYAKDEGDLIYIVGETLQELGGSQYFSLLGYTGNSVPQIDAQRAKTIYAALSRACALGLVKAMHDCSEGGMAVALSEMAFAGERGMEVFLAEAPLSSSMEKRSDYVLFSESNSRLIVEIDKKKRKAFERLLKGLPYGLIGCVNKGRNFKVYGLDGKVCLNKPIGELKEAWQKTLRW